MPEFCTKCGNMVADGVDRCLACGARIQPRMINKEIGFSWADLFNYSFVTIGFALLAIIVPILIVLGCLLLYF